MKISHLEARRCCCPDPVYILERRNTRENDPETLCRNVRIPRSGSDNHWRSNVLRGDKDGNHTLDSQDSDVSTQPAFREMSQRWTYLYHTCVHGNRVNICRRRCQSAEYRSLRSCKGMTGSDPQLQTGRCKKT